MKSHHIAICLVIVVLVGCNRPQPQYGEVTGKVTLQGEPLPNIQLSFMAEPDSGTYAPFTSGITDQEGRYRIRTVEGEDGAVVGSYTVVLKEMGARDPDKALVPQPYRYAAKTPLKGVKVKAGSNEHNFELVPDP